MISHGKLDTIRRSGRHLGGPSIAAADQAPAATVRAAQWLPARPAAGSGAAAAPRWHTSRERTT
jgi:hypothetical protein